MTETDWLSSTTPRVMLMALEARAKAGEIDRKLRLFACSCARRVWHLLSDQRSREAVEIAERFADGLVDLEGLIAAHAAAESASGDAYRSSGLAAIELARVSDPELSSPEGWLRLESSPEMRALQAAFTAAASASWARVASRRADEVFEGKAWVAAIRASACAFRVVANVEQLRAKHEAFLARKKDHALSEDPWQSDRLRCIFGSPFRPTTMNPRWSPDPVTSLARSVYGQRDFDRMPILGEMLREVGCTDEAILAHCRGPAEHGRGCWVIDALLGKS